MTILRSLKTLAALGSVCFLTSCAGYRLGADKPEKMAAVHTLAVPVFKNETLEPRCAVLVTNNVIKQFQMDSTYKVTSVGKADAVLRGTIRNFERRQLRGARTNVLKSRELEIRLWVDYQVEDPKTGTTLLKGTANGSTSVFLDPNFQLTERQAIDQASQRVAEDILGRVAEGW
ncbi:MAG: hypothetical protein KA004_03305 [Verrucomicrobiales bacterium]|nr:hypothetical protein [Verrucomicrobiales bacterium]